jgi:hypothetical protein
MPIHPLESNYKTVNKQQERNICCGLSQRGIGIVVYDADEQPHQNKASPE